jgi:hypothetical protein
MIFEIRFDFKMKSAAFVENLGIFTEIKNNNKK